MGWTIAVGVLAVLVVAEGIALAVLWSRLQASRQEADELRGRLDTRNLLWAGGREAVKTVWQTANLVRTQGFGGAVRSSIEELADWADVERPDLAKLAPGRQRGDHVLRHRGVHRAERTHRRPLVRQGDRSPRPAGPAAGPDARRARGQEPGRRVHGGLRRPGRRGAVRGGDAAGAREGRQAAAAQQYSGSNRHPHGQVGAPRGRSVRSQRGDGGPGCRPGRGRRDPGQRARPPEPSTTRSSTRAATPNSRDSPAATASTPLAQ